MSRLKNRYPKIQTRLIIGLILIISAFSISSVLFYRDIKELNRVTNDIIEHPYTVSNSVRDIDIYINAMHRTMKDVVLAENEAELNNYIEIIDENEQIIYKNFEVVKEKFLGNLEFVNDAYTTFANWKPIRDEVINLVKNGNIADAVTITKVKGKNHTILLFQKTRKMIDFANEKAASFNQNSINILRKATFNFLLFLIGSTILGVLLFLWIFFSISNPINKMISRIKNVPGDKMKELPLNTGNSLEVLDYAISEFENREKFLEENITIRTDELNRAQKLLERSIDNANIGIITSDLDNNLKTVNKYFCNFIGYAKEDLLKMMGSDFTRAEDKAEVSEFLKKVVDGKIKGESYERAFVHKSGKILYGSVSMSLVRDINSKPLYLFSQISDISKQKRYQIELTSYKNELETKIKNRTTELDDKAAKLGKSQQALTYLLEDVNDIKKQLEISNRKLTDANRELEAFSYSVSHDLKAPLRAVIGFSQILKEDFAPRLDDESKRYIGLIISNAENMGALINDLLNFSRMARTKLQKTKINLCTIGQRVKDELMVDVQNRNLSINIMDMPLVNADEKLIYHVMLNLISNGVKFTGQVENAVVEIGFTTKNNEKIFYIKDNGIGFNMKYAGKIFDVFQRLHSVEEFPGTGIGLSIVQRIIHKHEGRIWVESEMNIGTTFFFTL